MRVLTDEQHEEFCKQFMPIPIPARASVQSVPMNPAPVLTNVRNTYVPITAPSRLVDLAISQANMTGKLPSDNLRGFRNIIDKLPKRQVMAEEAEVLRQVDTGVDDKMMMEIDELLEQIERGDESLELMKMAEEDARERARRAFEQQMGAQPQTPVPETRAERAQRLIQERLRMTPAEQLELAKMREEERFQRIMDPYGK